MEGEATVPLGKTQHQKALGASTTPVEEGEAIMSAPIKQDENSKGNSQDPLLYAPPWARAQGVRRDPRLTNSLPPAPQLGDSKIDWPPQPSKLAPFEGDVAMTALRHRLALDPQLVPEPPVRMQQKPAARSLLTKLPLYIALAAVITYAVLEFNLSYGDYPIIPNSEHSPAKASRLNGTSGENQPRAATRLVVEDRQAFTNEPLPLGVVLVGATGGESVLLNGLVKGTRLSAGEPLSSTGWRVSGRELSKLHAYAPTSFVGIMDADLQDEPETLIEMYRLLRAEQLDVVYAVRASRQENILKRFFYFLFYRLFLFLADSPVDVDSGDFCVMSRRGVRQLLALPEKLRFVRGLRAWLGLRGKAFPVSRAARAAGQLNHPQWDCQTMYLISP
jgi:hypothetical protein